MMDFELANNIALTAMVFMILFIGVMRFHGDDKPPYAIMVIEVIGFAVSVLVLFVFTLISIWIR